MLMNKNLLIDQVNNWLREDIGNFDLTSQILIGPGTKSVFHLIAREPTVISGLEVVSLIFDQIDNDLKFETFYSDMDEVTSGAKIASISGQASSILTAERVALNIFQRMCGIATLAAAYVQEISGTSATLVDTRKTTPGLRSLEKYAFYCGGGKNHRFGLDSGVMLKDNHIALVGDLSKAVKLVKSRMPILLKVEVECETLVHVKKALDAGADLIMLDNMSLEEMRDAVLLVNGRIPLECSGGVTLRNIKEKAETGVNFISVGAITQSANCIDIGLDF